MISVGGGYLIFLALMVTASTAALSSEHVQAMPTWLRLLLLVPLVISAAAGIAALIGANSAHNLGRRSEKLARPNLTGSQKSDLESEVENARKLGGKALFWSMLGAIVSATSLSIAMACVVIFSPEPSNASEGSETQQPTPGHPSLEKLGEIIGFQLGEVEPSSADYQFKIDKIMRAWCARKASGQSGILLVIGSTDRVPLRGDTLRRFDSNVGLAQARANWVADRLFPANEQAPVISLAAGPRTTPESLLINAGSGIEDDRRVAVWAFWQPADDKGHGDDNQCIE